MIIPVAIPTILLLIDGLSIGLVSWKIRLRAGAIAQSTSEREQACIPPLKTCLCQPGAEYFQQCTEFPLLCNRGLGPFAVTVLPISLASRGTATSCAAVQFVAGDRQGLPVEVRAPHFRAV